MAHFEFTSGGAPLLAVDASTAGPPLEKNRQDRRSSAIYTNITSADLSSKTRKIWGVTEAWRELTQNLTDAILRASYPSPARVEWTTEATEFGARFLLNGAYGGEWAVVYEPPSETRHADGSLKKSSESTVRAYFYNRGRAMPPDAFLQGYTDKDDIDACRLQLAGGFGSGLKDGLCALLRDGATSVRVFTHSPGSEVEKKRYWLKVPDSSDDDDMLPFSGSNRPLKLHISDSHPSAPHAVSAIFRGVAARAQARGGAVARKKAAGHAATSLGPASLSAARDEAPSAAAPPHPSASTAPFLAEVKTEVKTEGAPVASSGISSAAPVLAVAVGTPPVPPVVGAAVVAVRGRAVRAPPVPSVAGTVVVVEYQGVGSWKAAQLREAAACHFIMQPLSADVKRISVTARLADDPGSLPYQCQVLLLPHDGGRCGGRFYLAPGLKYASIDLRGSAALSVRVDVVVPGHALEINRDRIAPWDSVKDIYARVVLRAARNEWLSERPADAPPLPHEKDLMLAALPPLNRAIAEAVWRVVGVGDRERLGVLADALYYTAGDEDSDGKAAADQTQSDDVDGPVHASAHVGGVLFRHFHAISTDEDFAMATRLYESQQANAALLAAARVDPRHEPRPLRVPQALVELLSHGSSVSVETRRRGYLLHLAAAQEALAAAPPPGPDAPPPPAWTAWPQAEDAAAWAMIKEMAKDADLPRIFALPVPADLLHDGQRFETLDNGRVLVFAESSLPSFHEVISHLCTFNRALRDLSVERLLVHAVQPPPPPTVPQQLEPVDVDLDGPRGADDWFERDAPPSPLAAPPAVAAGDAEDAKDKEGANEADGDEEEDDDESEVDDDDYGGPVAGRKRRRDPSVTNWIEPTAAVSALLRRSELACGAGADDAEPPFVKVVVRRQELYCLCGKVPKDIVPHPLVVLDGHPKRVVYAAPGDDVHVVLSEHNVSLDSAGMSDVAAFLTVVRDALRRLLLGERPSAAAVAACVLELRVAASSDVFIVGNLRGHLYVNLSWLPMFKKSLQMILAPLAHAVAHNYGPDHGFRYRAHESYLLRLLQEDPTVFAAHQALGGGVD